MTVAGLLLAAGAGRRMGSPKALLRDRAGVPYVDRAIGVLLDGGCATVTVVTGAAAPEARALMAEAGWDTDPAVDVVEAPDWDTGMGASLRAGLAALPVDADVAVVTLVDLPDVSSAVVGRVLSGAAGAAGAAGADGAGALARASYGGRGGHPVVIGRDHWEGVVATAAGDRGARDYLARQEVTLVECGDLATGHDVDRPSDLKASGGSAHDA